MTLRSLGVVVLSLSTAPLLAQGEGGGGSRVTVPLSEYEALKKVQERSSVTVVDVLRLGGSFKARELSVVFTGRAAGSLPPVDVLRNASGIVLYGCDGDGILSRGDGGKFLLTPLAGRFTVRCRLAARGSDRLEMQSTPAVLWIESAIEDGEFVLGQESEDGARAFTVVRRVTVAASGLPASATGRYKISLRPDETRFHYEIAVHNPNRARQPFDVALASGEHVQQVDAPVSYDVQGARYRFDIPPGETAITLSGSLPGSSFQSPIQASLQYGLLESHPLLRPAIVGEPKRVSPQEVGIATEYRGAQAFLVAGREPITWTVTRLEALRTTSFAVKQATNIFFLAADGKAIGQTSVSIDNQGSPDISLPMSAEPTFASLDGEPVLLTKDAKGNLWLPIAQGAQELMVQHRQPFRRVPGFGLASLALPQLAVPATNGSVNLRYPSEWFPLYESFLSEARFWTPDAGAIFAFLLLFVWTERSLAALGRARAARWVMAGGLTLAALSWGWALLALLAADAAVALTYFIPWMRARHWNVGVVVLLVGGLGLVLFLLAIAIPSLLRARVAPSYPSGSEYVTRGSDSGADKAVRGKTDDGERQAEAYQGLPAKFEIPWGAEQTTFSRELLDTETPRQVRVVMISQTLLGWLQTLVVLAAILGLWRDRHALATGWGARRAALRATPSEPAV